MHEYSASLLQSEDDMCMYFDAAEDQNVDESNQEPASPVREVPAGMPEEYYHGLESFLSQAPPALDMFSSQSTSAAASTATAVHNNSKQQRRSSGSKNKLTNQTQQQRQQQSHPPHHQSSARSRQRQPASGRGTSEFDFDLLQQAMQYTARLALEDCPNEQPDIDDPPPPPPSQQQQHQQQRRHSRGGKQKPPLRRNSSSRSVIVVREKSSSTQLRSLPPAHAKKRLPRRMREAVSARQDEDQLQREASWSAPSAADTRPVEADNCLDVESLVENFEKGLTLEQLRQELAASQSSMNHSHDILAKAAAEFFAQHGGSF